MQWHGDGSVGRVWLKEAGDGSEASEEVAVVRRRLVDLVLLGFAVRRGAVVVIVGRICTALELSLPLPFRSSPLSRFRAFDVLRRFAAGRSVSFFRLVLVSRSAARTVHLIRRRRSSQCCHHCCRLVHRASPATAAASLSSSPCCPFSLFTLEPRAAVAVLLLALTHRPRRRRSHCRRRRAAATLHCRHCHCHSSHCPHPRPPSPSSALRPSLPTLRIRPLTPLLGSWRRYVLLQSHLVHLDEVLLRVRPYLYDGLGRDELSYLLPISLVQLECIEKLGVLLFGPRLARLGDGVGLARLLGGGRLGRVGGARGLAGGGSGCGWW